jgi:hypothetical protein
MNKDIDSLTKSADVLYEKAESSGNLTYVAKANAFRKSSKEKSVELKKNEEKLEEKLSELKNI